MRRRETIVKRVVHGTLNAYTHHRCRCDRCRAAWSDAAKRYRDTGSYSEAAT